MVLWTVHYVPPPEVEQLGRKRAVFQERHLLCHLYSYGLYSCGIYSCGLDSYGLDSYGLERYLPMSP